MRFKDFINEDLTMQGTGQTAGIAGGTQANQMQNQGQTNPLMNNPAMKDIVKSLDTINQKAGMIGNPLNQKAIKTNVSDFKNMLQQGPNPQNQNNLAKRNINNVKTGINVPNRTNMGNQPNINPQLNNNGNNVNGGNIGN